MKDIVHRFSKQDKVYNDEAVLTRVRELFPVLRKHRHHDPGEKRDKTQQSQRNYVLDSRKYTKRRANSLVPVYSHLQIKKAW